MKKKFLISGLILTMILTGCSKNKETESQETEIQEVTTEETTETSLVKNTTKNNFVYEDNVIKLAQYKGLEYGEAIKEVTDEDVEEEIETNLSYSSTYEQIYEGIAKDGDTVNIDYYGRIDGISFKGGTADGVELTLGSNQFISGFEEQIVGMSVNERKDIVVTFPEDYGVDELNGKEAVFSILLNYICGELQTPELTDEFVKANSNSNTVEEYKIEIRNQLEESNKAYFESSVQDDLLNQIVSNSIFLEISQDELTERYESELEQYKGYASMFGLEYEDFISQMMQQDTKEFETALRLECENELKIEIALNKIAEIENIIVSDEDFDEFLNQIVIDYGYESLDELKTELAEQNTEELARTSCLNNKIYNFIYENATYNPEKEVIEEAES